MPVNMDEARRVFTPSSPIQHKDLFRGRTTQITRAVDAFSQPGLHPVIFGQRGVGKTSLANVLRGILPNSLAVKITCDTSDTFDSIWQKVFKTVTLSFKVKAFGFSPELAEKRQCLADYLPKDKPATPSDIVDVLSDLAQKAVFIFDEFDRVSDTKTRLQVADFIKIISDNSTKVTIVLVGVGKSISDLISAHESIVRNLRQIEMPSMSKEELKEILKSGYLVSGVSASEEMLDELAVLCGGYPHYAHLLGLATCKACAEQGTEVLSNKVIEIACQSAVSEAIETLRESFHKATATSMPSNYPTILIACGLADYDERGVFRATDVVDAANGYLGADFKIQSVVPALGAFTTPDRGSVLEAISVVGRNQYRLREPMMRPYLRIRARLLT